MPLPQSQASAACSRRWGRGRLSRGGSQQEVTTTTVSSQTPLEHPSAGCKVPAPAPASTSVRSAASARAAAIAAHKTSSSSTSAQCSPAPPTTPPSTAATATAATASACSWRPLDLDSHLKKAAAAKKMKQSMRSTGSAGPMQPWNSWAKRPLPSLCVAEAAVQIETHGSGGEAQKQREKGKDMKLHSQTWRSAGSRSFAEHPQRAEAPTAASLAPDFSRAPSASPFGPAKLDARALSSHASSSPPSVQTASAAAVRSASIVKAKGRAAGASVPTEDKEKVTSKRRYDPPHEDGSKKAAATAAEAVEALPHTPPAKRQRRSYGDAISIASSPGTPRSTTGDGEAAEITAAAAATTTTAATAAATTTPATTTTPAIEATAAAPSLLIARARALDRTQQHAAAASRTSGDVPAARERAAEELFERPEAELANPQLLSRQPGAALVHRSRAALEASLSSLTTAVAAPPPPRSHAPSSPDRPMSAVFAAALGGTNLSPHAGQEQHHQDNHDPSGPGSASAEANTGAAAVAPAAGAVTARESGGANCSGFLHCMNVEVDSSPSQSQTRQQGRTRSTPAPASGCEVLDETDNSKGPTAEAEVQAQARPPRKRRSTAACLSPLAKSVRSIRRRSGAQPSLLLSSQSPSPWRGHEAAAGPACSQEGSRNQKGKGMEKGRGKGKGKGKGGKGKAGSWGSGGGDSWQRLVCFSASEVAALVGLHKYGTPLHAFLRCWRRYHPGSLRRWERETGGVALPEALFARHASASVQQAVDGAVRKSGDGALHLDAEAAIGAAVKSSGAPQELWATLTEEALARARRARGTNLEVVGLDAYEQQSGRRVIRRNQDRFRSCFGCGESAFCIAGRVDGFEDDPGFGQRFVVEHKRRQRRLFQEVPVYEEVQCQTYMVLAGVRGCRWVQTMGPKVQSRLLMRCPRRWQCIRGRLRASAQLLRELVKGIVRPDVKGLEILQQEAWTHAAPWPEGKPPEEPDFTAQRGAAEAVESIDDASLRPQPAMVVECVESCSVAAVAGAEPAAAATTTLAADPAAKPAAAAAAAAAAPADEAVARMCHLHRSEPPAAVAEAPFTVPAAASAPAGTTSFTGYPLHPWITAQQASSLQGELDPPTPTAFALPLAANGKQRPQSEPASSDQDSSSGRDGKGRHTDGECDANRRCNFLSIPHAATPPQLALQEQPPLPPSAAAVTTLAGTGANATLVDSEAGSLISISSTVHTFHQATAPQCPSAQFGLASTSAFKQGVGTSSPQSQSQPNPLSFALLAESLQPTPPRVASSSSSSGKLMPAAPCDREDHDQQQLQQQQQQLQQKPGGEVQEGHEPPPALPPPPLPPPLDSPSSRIDGLSPKRSAEPAPGNRRAQEPLRISTPEKNGEKGGSQHDLCLTPSKRTGSPCCEGTPPKPRSESTSLSPVAPTELDEDEEDADDENSNEEEEEEEDECNAAGGERADEDRIQAVQLPGDTGVRAPHFVFDLESQ